MPRKLPVFVVVGGVRMLMWIGVGSLAIWLGADRPFTLLVVFMVMYGLATSCVDITNVPRMDIIGKSVFASARARMFTGRMTKVLDIAPED